MGTTRRFKRTPDNRKRLTLDIDDVRFTFNTRITRDVARQVEEMQASGSVDPLADFLKGRLVSTNTENEPAVDFDRADLDVPEMRDLLTEIMENGGLGSGELEPSSTPSNADEGSSSSTSNTSTASTSTTSSSEPIASGSFT